MFCINLPNNLSEFILHKKICKKLLTKNYDNFTNLLFYGITGVGKKHLVRNLLKHIFKIDNLVTKNNICDLKINNSSVTINYTSSIYHYEINLYEYGLYDKNIITEFLKDIISTKNVNNNSYRIVILHKLDKVSESAQLTLRRIIETYYDNCRFIIIADNLSKINYTLLSRFELIRVSFPKKEELISYCNIQNQLLKLNLSDNFIQKIIDTDYNQYNLNILNYNLCHTINDFNIIDICDNFNQIIKQENKFFMDKLRKYIYRLHLLNYNYTKIIKNYLNFIIKNNLYKKFLPDIIKKASQCEYNCRLSKVYFFSLESFFVYLKSLEIKK